MDKKEDIIKTITVDQIESIIDDYLQEYKSGRRKHANILFEGYAGYGRSRVIKRWLDKHEELQANYNVYPGKLHKDVSGIFVVDKEKGIPQYAIPDTELATLSKVDSVLMLKNLNYGRDYAGDNLLYSIIKDRNIETFSGKKYDLDNLIMVIATSFKEDSQNRIFPIDEMKKCFDIYNVTANMQETADYIYKELEFEKEKYPAEKKDKIDCKIKIADCLRKWPEQIQHTEEFSPAILNMAFYHIDKEWDEAVKSFCKFFKNQIGDETVSVKMEEILLSSTR